MSYIGQALGRLGSKRNLKKSSKKSSKLRKWGKCTSWDPDNDSGDSSDSSSSTSDYDTTDSASKSTESSESSDSLSDGPKRSKRSRLKPIPPVTYDRSPDSRSFHQFLTKGTTYVKDGKVERHKRVFILVHYLKGRAREFYTREVSGDPYRWRLKDFFTELFNYCFPINFRMKQREKLNRCYQNDKTVHEYIYELSELWNMIGNIGERQKVTCLWTGLSATIQTKLWKKELNPESSSFHEVKNVAEIIEIAHLVPTRDRDCRPKDKAPKGEANSRDNPRGSKGDAPGCRYWNDQKQGNNRYPKCGEPKAEGSNKAAGTSRDPRPKGGKTKGASGGRQPEKMSVAE